MNIRQAITRTLTYSKVTVTVEGETSTHLVNGSTTVKAEMLKFLKNYDGSEMPTISIEVFTEKRAMTLEDFISNSTVINESEEN